MIKFKISKLYTRQYYFFAMTTKSVFLNLQLLFLSVMLFGCQEEIALELPLLKIEEAKSFLYENNITEGERTLNNIDTALLDDYGKASYHVALSFLYYLKGNRIESTKYLMKGAFYFDQTDYDEEKAEIDLISGFLLESALLRPEAAKSYIKGLKYYSSNKKSDKYFKCLLGVIRTGPKGKSFLEEADAYIELNPTNKNKFLYLSAIATLKSDKKEKLKLLLESIQYYDEDYNKRNLVRLYSNIAKTYQSINMGDSAEYFIDLSEHEIKNTNIRESTLGHYFLIRAYIEYRNDHIQDAINTISTVLNINEHNPGVMAHSYRIRSEIRLTQGELEYANDDLKKYIDYIKLEYDQNKLNQIGLINMQLLLKQKELELVQIRNNWLLSSLILLAIILFSWLLFRIYRLRMLKKKKELIKVNTIVKSKLKEQMATNLQDVRILNGHSNNIALNGEELKVAGLTKQEFNTYFNIEYPLFRKKLSSLYPNLSNTDMKYCDCILAELTLYQTATVLGVTESAVKKARRKLKGTFKCKNTVEVFLRLKEVNESVEV